MNKAKIKDFAIWAREKLIADIKDKARFLGIMDSGIAEALPQSTADLMFFDIGTKDYAEVSGEAVQQREALVKAIKIKEQDTKDYKKALDFIAEEVAYTWFNRLVAIRFMEVNDYLPSGIRVLSSTNPAKLEPDFVTTPFDTDMEFTPYEQDRIIQMKDENKLDELFRMLFIKQCNKLHEILPELFETTADYTELLLTISFKDTEGVVYRLVHDIDEDDFNVEKEGQVEIIGWLYQYYNAEKKNKVFAALKDKEKISKDNIPAATQLFTPDWIVRYMVENSLGRLWLEHNAANARGDDDEVPGDLNEYLLSNWKYYVFEAEQEPEVEKKLEEIRKSFADLTPEQIKIIDPCCGSGHILVYAFDVLMQIYESVGYTARSAVSSIISNNIYGLDIDKRAAQLTYFALMMKARQYDRRFLSRRDEDGKIKTAQPHVYEVRESNGINRRHLDFMGGSMDEFRRNNAKTQMNGLLDTLRDAKEYGSILDVEPYDWELLRQFVNDTVSLEAQMNLETTGIEQTIEKIDYILHLGQVMAQKYHVVTTNPPYMGSNGMNAKLSAYVKKFYPDSKADLFAVFIEKCRAMTVLYGYQAMITQHAWMFLNSYEKLRRNLYNQNILTMAHLGARAFAEIAGEVVQTTSFVTQKCYIHGRKGVYFRLVEPTTQIGKELLFLSGNNRYEIDQSNFPNIPGAPLAYWVSDKIFDILSHEKITKVSFPCLGMRTGDNDRFLRLWYEVAEYRASYFDLENHENKKWIPYNKGGGYRRWYGYNEYLVNWENDGYEIKENTKIKYGENISWKISNERLYFGEGITWGAITSGATSFRYYPKGFIFSNSGQAVILNSDSKDMICSMVGYLNTNLIGELLKILSPTVGCESGYVSRLPYQKDLFGDKRTADLAEENIKIAKLDWDSFETSWDFQKNPLVQFAPDWDRGTDVYCSLIYFANQLHDDMAPIEVCYLLWKDQCEQRFKQLQKNEEELNRIFIDIYGLQDELTPEVEDKDITVYRVFDSKDEIPESMGSSRYALTKQDVVKDFVSYAVGCMLGRYSLDVEGLVSAGGELDDRNYSTFIPDADNCIPITDEAYFQDDIVGRFVEFVKTVYGAETLEANLTFIAKALGNRGKTSREIIRNYFLNDFYKDHLKKYQKRPIYWLFDSGKQNGFKALVYMHRWNKDTVGNLRAEYLLKMRDVYDKEIDRMQDTIDNSGDNKEIAAAGKRKEKLQKQLKEVVEYDSKIAYIALSQIDIDLDDGVKTNHNKVQLGPDGKSLEILSKI